MDFSLIDYLDEAACYTKLLELLHPDGLACPQCGERQRLGIHRRHRDPVLDYQCGACGRVFNAWTGTALQGTHRRPAQVLMILHGITKGTPTATMARELGCDRRWLLALRHRLQEFALRWLDRNPLGDAVVEADEMYQNAGEKGIPHDDPEDPPRRRANNRRGHGTFATDRPPIAGVVGRESGELRMEVLETASGSELDDGRRRHVPGGDGGEHRRVEGVQPGGEAARPGASDGGPLGPQEHMGRRSPTATACARSTATRRRGYGRACGTSSVRSGG